MAFNALVKRTVYLVNVDSKTREKFTIAIGAPYRPPNAKDMAGHAACLVQVYEEIDDVGFEIFGADEFEALRNALDYAKTLLDKMASQGVVETETGKPYGSVSSSAYTRTLESLLNRILRKPKR